MCDCLSVMQPVLPVRPGYSNFIDFRFCPLNQGALLHNALDIIHTISTYQRCWTTATERGRSGLEQMNLFLNWSTQPQPTVNNKPWYYSSNIEISTHKVGDRENEKERARFSPDCLLLSGMWVISELLLTEWHHQFQVIFRRHLHDLTLTTDMERN